MNSALVEIRHVHKVHERPSLLAAGRRAVHAVNDVSLEIERGRTFGLVGESGSGKSTLARAILHLDPPTQGSVLFDGKEVGAMTRTELMSLRRRAQIVSQDPTSALNPRLRVHTSVAEGVVNAGVAATRRRERVAEVLNLVGIPPARMADFPHEFSGGMKQRICIARALAVEPEFLILDEPVSSLDVSIQAQIINLLLDLQQSLGLTYLFISHDINLVAYLCDTIGVMRRGTLVELAPAERLMTEPEHEYTKSLLASVPRYVDQRRFHHNLHTRSAV